MLTLKVGVMPGRLQEVVVENKTSARRIFEIAGVEISNHEVRLDGEKIDLDMAVENGKLLVAMKMIKGNASTIKVGVMPGRLQEVVYEEGTTARELLDMAGVEVSNHEIRLDGNKIGLDEEINGGNLLVAMKMIKGNASVYKSTFTEEERYILLGYNLPQALDDDMVKINEYGVIVVEYQGEELCFDIETFTSVYDKVNSEVETVEAVEKIDIQEVKEETTCGCTHKMALDILKEEYEEEMKSYNTWIEIAMEHKKKADYLEKLIARIQG